MRSRILYARSPQWAELLARPEELFTRAEFREVKNIARNRAGFFTAPGAVVFVKRFAPGSRVEGIRERLQGSRAARSLRACEILTAADFLVPAPLAASEQLSAGAVSASWMISEALDQAQVLSRFIERGHAPAALENPLRREALAAVAAAVRRMHDAGVFSSDLQETNLMLDRAGGALRIYFVDLDRFRRMGRVGWKRRRRNLVQLDRSVGRFMSRSERLRFLRSYLGEGWDRRTVRKLVQRLMRERDRKEREFALRRLRRTGRGGPRPGQTQEREAPAPGFSQPG
jgi:tRNA A-37 threonylcarbamoyl transferase component Bud32